MTKWYLWINASSKSNSIEFDAGKWQANELNENEPNVKTWPFSAIVTNNNCSHVRSIRKRANQLSELDGTCVVCTHRPKTFCLLNDPVCCLVWHSMRSHNEMLNNKKTWQAFAMSKTTTINQQQEQRQYSSTKFNEWIEYVYGLAWLAWLSVF